MDSTSRPSVRFVAPVREPVHPIELARLAREVAEQRGVRASLALVDLTRAGLEQVPEGIAVARPGTPSFARGLELALEGETPDLVAWCDPRVRLDPLRALAQVEALATRAEALAVTSSVTTLEPSGSARRFDGARAAGEVVPFWLAGTAMRPAALESLDRAAFGPVELRWLKRLAETGTLVHADRLLGRVELEHVDAEAERRATDWMLDELRAKSLEHDRPLVTVLIPTYRRRAVLLECLEGFARQLVPPGWHELVVVEDGAGDGTAEFLAQLELDVPLTVLEQPNAGPATARNRGLEVARGELVLFVNDDTIPAPDLIVQHVLGHREHPGAVSILGTFEQPESQVRSAGMRLIERRPFVFAYMEFEDGQELEPERFYTCNVSTPLNAVRTVGGFDEAFRLPAAEDTDLGLRLHRAGVPLIYRAAARSEHRHVLIFDDLRRRQAMVGREHVRLWARHPDALAANRPVMAADQEGLSKIERIRSGILELTQRAAQGLFELPIVELAEAGETGRELSDAGAGLLEELMIRLNALWFNAGLLDGLVEHDVDSFVELHERAVRAEAHTPPGIPEADLTCDRPTLSIVTLVEGEDRHSVESWLTWVRRELSEAPPLELILVDGRVAPDFELRAGIVVRDASPSRGVRLAAGLEAARAETVLLLPVGVVPNSATLAAQLERLGQEPRLEAVTAPLAQRGAIQGLPSAEEVHGWWGAVVRRHLATAVPAEAFAPAEEALLRAARIHGTLDRVEDDGSQAAEELVRDLSDRAELERLLLDPLDAPLPDAEGEPERLTVAIRSSGEPEVLFACLAGFCRQVGVAGAFEVVVVRAPDADPACDRAAGLAFPVPVRFVPAAAHGEPAAFNEALREARGELVLFALDDTVPGPDCVAGHLAAHAAAASTVDPIVRGGLGSPGGPGEDGSVAATPRRSERGTPCGVEPFPLTNVSVRRGAVLEVGGLDESLDVADLAGVDLRIRLETFGCVVQQVSEVRAVRRPRADLDATLELETGRARASLQLFAKHPELLAPAGCEELCEPEIERRLAAAPEELAERTRILQVLGELPLEPLERLGGYFAEFAACIAEAARVWSTEILEHARDRGFLAGLHERDVTSTEPLWASRAPFVLQNENRRHVFAWPLWSSSEDLDVLVDSLEPLLGTRAAILVLRHDASLDRPKTEAVAAFEAAYAGRFPDAPDLEVLLEDRPLTPDRLLALVRACDAWIPAGGEPDGLAPQFGAEPLPGSGAVARWVRRVSGPDAVRRAA